MTWTEACKIGPALVARYCPATPKVERQQYSDKLKLWRAPGYYHGHKLRPNEKPLIEWIKEVAGRDGVSPSAVRMRCERGYYSDHKFRRINKRVVFVTPPSV